MTIAGDKAKVQSWLDDVMERTGADELMINSRVYDPQARLKSHQYAAEAIGIAPQA